MTQARDILPLRLQLTPMQVSDTAPQPIGRVEDRPEEVLMKAMPTGMRDCHLTLYPGEPAEILVQLENVSHRPLQLDIQVKGNFPLEWYRLGLEGHEIPAKGQIEAVLYFQLATHFFESKEYYESGQSPQLDYQGQLYAYYTEPDTGKQRTAVGVFHLYIRPRSLYLDFLPEIYREVDFIGRFLKIFEQTFEPAVQTLDVLWAYLDPLLSPEAMLPFLAHWVGWPLNPALSLNRQRYLIRQAIQLYRWRGTRRGLRFYLHLFTDLPLDEHLPEDQKHISIQEVFSRGLVIGDTRLNRDSFMGGGQPYHFIVLLRPDHPNQIDEQLVHQIIQQEKPAFCTYELYIE